MRVDCERQLFCVIRRKKLYKTTVRPATMYVPERWTVETGRLNGGRATMENKNEKRVRKSGFGGRRNARENVQMDRTWSNGKTVRSTNETCVETERGVRIESDTTPNSRERRRKKKMRRGLFLVNSTRQRNYTPTTTSSSAENRKHFYLYTFTQTCPLPDA